MGKTITLTTSMGNFTFEKNVIISKAKLIRDSIVGHYFNPRVGVPYIRTDKDAYEYAQSHLGRDLESIPFELSISIRPWGTPIEESA